MFTPLRSFAVWPLIKRCRPSAGVPTGHGLLAVGLLAACQLAVGPPSLRVAHRCFCRQADGLKEGDYIVAVGKSDCKWLGVSEVMRLLRDGDGSGDQMEIQVVSMMDSSPTMVGRA